MFPESSFWKHPSRTINYLRESSNIKERPRKTNARKWEELGRNRDNEGREKTYRHIGKKYTVFIFKIMIIKKKKTRILFKERERIKRRRKNSWRLQIC